jgi:signal transduction histidine kinase
MVDLLQAENFAQKMTCRDVDFGDLVAGAAEDIRSFVTQRKQNLVIDVPGDLGDLRVDAEKLHDSIVQLLVNAVKFSPDGGTITLTARRSEREATIAVRDNGCGMDAQCQSRLFEPFFTGFDVAHHRSGVFEHNRRGMGLGLSIAKAFVEMHGGKIDVVSEKDAGTTFTIHLPLQPRNDPFSVEPTATAETEIEN